MLISRLVFLSLTLLSQLLALRRPARVASIGRAVVAMPAPLSFSSPGGQDLQPLKQLEQPEDSDEALIRRISEEVMAESGVELDQLINPSKVVNLERDLVKLAQELSRTGLSDVERAQVEATAAKKRSVLAVEKRAVMRGWLKGLFVGQSVLAGVISLGMVYNALPGVDSPLAVRVLGFWMWWLFIIPSLRARKPGNKEKEALNIAFLASPAASLIMPAITKDTAVIWWVNAAVVAACYAYAYTRPKGGDDDDGDSVDEELSNKSGAPSLLVKAFKALDYGSGQERGARQ